MTEGQDPAQDRGEGARSDEVGSAAEEAAKLFGAVGDWAKVHGGDVASNLAVGLTAGLSGLAGLAGQAHAATTDAEHLLEEHLATGAPECTYCPLCRTVHVVREASPEVIAHLATAATSLMQAAAAVLAAAGSAPTSPREATVEKIDLDTEQDWSDDWSDDEQETEQ